MNNFEIHKIPCDHELSPGRKPCAFKNRLYLEQEEKKVLGTWE